MKRKALGRGLSALIPEGTGQVPAAAQTPSSPTRDYYLCPIERIRPGTDQPRKHFDEERLEELADSIREQGVVQPLVVRPAGDGTFLLVAGERRWRAAQKAGLHDIPVVIREVNDAQAVELALVENLQREDLNPLEEAEALSRLMEEHGYTQERLAGRLGRDRSTVANSLRLLKLPEAARQEVISGAISAGHARALLGLESSELLQRVLQEVQRKDLSVRQTEALVRRLKEAPADEPPAKPEAPSANVRDLQEKLCRSLKTRVRLVTRSKSKGRIEIEYSSLDELDRLLQVLLD